MLSKNYSQVITVQTLYDKAKENNLLVTIEEKPWKPYFNVTLKCSSKVGSDFSFKGFSDKGLMEAFLEAFNEASVIGVRL